MSYAKKYFQETRERLATITQDSTWWVFVWNNPTDLKAPEGLKDLLEVWWQLEEGSTKQRPHLQGVAHFMFPKSRAQLREQIPCWWQLMQGTVSQAVRYSTKERTRLDGPWHWAFYTPYFATLDAILARPESDFKGMPVYGLFIGPCTEDQHTRPMIEQCPHKPYGDLLQKNGFIKL